MTTADIPLPDDNTPATRGDWRHLENTLRRDMDSLRADTRSLNRSFIMLAVGILSVVVTAALAIIFG